MASLVPFVRVGSAHAVRFVHTRRISVLGRIKRVAKNTKRNAVPIGFFPIELPVPHAANADFHHKVSVSRISLYSQSLQDHDPISSPRSQNLTQNRANSENITFKKSHRRVSADPGRDASCGDVTRSAEAVFESRPPNTSTAKRSGLPTSTVKERAGLFRATSQSFS